MDILVVNKLFVSVSECREFLLEFSWFVIRFSGNEHLVKIFVEYNLNETVVIGSTKQMMCMILSHYSTIGNLPQHRTSYSGIYC